MIGSEAALADLLDRLHHVFGNALFIVSASKECLQLRVGAHEDAVLSIRCVEPSRPAFRIAYPALTVKRDGSSHVSECVGEGVLDAGILWVAHQLLANGVVQPEFLFAKTPRDTRHENG